MIVLPLDSDLDLEQAQPFSESHHIPLFIIAPAGDFQYRLQAVQLASRVFFSVPLSPVPFVDSRTMDDQQH